MIVHYVYVLRSAHDDGLYIGYSANLRRRFMQHCNGTARATAHRRPWTLIYYEAYLAPADALGREKYFKSGSGRRFLNAQLRNYLAESPLNHVAKLYAANVRKPRERSFYAALMSLTGRVLASVVPWTSMTHLFLFNIAPGIDEKMFAIKYEFSYISR